MQDFHTCLNRCCFIVLHVFWTVPKAPSMLSQLSLCKFLTPALVDCFSLETERQQVSSGHRTLLNFLADFNNAVVWMVAIRPPISNPSSPFSKPLGTVPSVPITISITVTFTFHRFLSSLLNSQYLSLFSLSLIFTLWSAGTPKSIIKQVLCFCQLT